MSEKNLPEKQRLHPRNKNREKYDLEALLTVQPDLEKHIKPNKYGENSVDFANPAAVKLLNKALLHHYYGIENWDFPDENLTPPIPGRADYIHFMADLLVQSNFGTIPEGEKITCLDIGVGASAIYPIIGVAEYGWNFIGSDIDEKSLDSAQKIVDENPQLKDKIILRLQENSNQIFKGIIENEEKIDLTFCNPPFHASNEEAEKGSRRKVQNLVKKQVKKAELNFSGLQSELIYEGGEAAFIHKMMAESQEFSENCYWFSTLVSKQSNLKGIYKTLNELEVVGLKTIPLGTGNKSSRIIAWTFLSKEDQKNWRETRWRSQK
ncbi:23S rRNA (adenine(1618)-N(6))-methyltransferase RlmF [Chryseobacterium sp. H3056]|uniref:Ribosomal RNA large subunit methyltransferase F n=1 Tax=Kaistella daneshvariae TaxID=2487074 RepID=A0A3N0WV19_9FLAO|nr:23S rRNA (adenine(1618)-N(6))-methyltransferase RlmF [Kaistella daneshvariae]ROI08914.1 23S rRNA (adenine(1618)-N(6))-methyltransferase RlmF [Kaistella daneshvariae]